MLSLLPHAIAGATVVFGVRLVQQYLHDRKRATVEAVEGVAHLRYGPVFRCVTAALLVVPSAGFSALAWANPAQTTADALAWLGLQAGFLLLGVPLVLEAFGVRHQVDRWGLHYRTPWSRERTIPWENVREITWSERARWWVITTYDGDRARLPELLDGIDTFLESARCYAPIEPELRKLGCRSGDDVAEMGCNYSQGATHVVIVDIGPPHSTKSYGDVEEAGAGAHWAPRMHMLRIGGASGEVNAPVPGVA